MKFDKQKSSRLETRSLDRSMDLSPLSPSPLPFKSTPKRPLQIRNDASKQIADQKKYTQTIDLNKIYNMKKKKREVSVPLVFEKDEVYGQQERDESIDEIRRKALRHRLMKELRFKKMEEE